MGGEAWEAIKAALEARHGRPTAADRLCSGGIEKNFAKALEKRLLSARAVPFLSYVCLFCTPACRLMASALPQGAQAGGLSKSTTLCEGQGHGHEERTADDNERGHPRHSARSFEGAFQSTTHRAKEAQAGREPWAVSPTHQQSQRPAPHSTCARRFREGQGPRGAQGRG
jgi:hypothetical protein